MSPAPGEAPLLLASNRGPLSFTLDRRGGLEARRGGGGLVSALSSLEGGSRSLWVCAAVGEADTRAASRAPGGRLDLAGHPTGGAGVRMLTVDPATMHLAYNEVANRTLWFLHHLLFDGAHQPVFDADFRRAWEAYTVYGATFAEALAAEAAPGARVLVQDYHLTLVPAQLRELRPDLRIAHFSHTPWAPPEYFSQLPTDVGRAVLAGMLGADHVGFHARRWADAFAVCCEQLLPGAVRTGREELTWCGRRVTLGVHPLGVDGPSLVERAGRPDVTARLAELREQTVGLAVVVRVDRTELSKNVLRGLMAYRELLRTRPYWRGRVVHLALAYPSRHDLPEYREYTAELQRLAADIDREFATPGWRPLDLRVDDDYPRSLAAYRLADVLLVNPVRDGMNLVAREGPVVSDHGVSLVLSQEAGAADHVGGDAQLVNPFDVSATADALDRALRTPPAHRLAATRRLAASACANPPDQWLATQAAALGRPD